MSVVSSFRVVFLTSRVFGIFPYRAVTTTEFRLCESILKQGRCILGFVLIVRIIVLCLDVKYNVHTSKRRMMTLFRLGNTTSLHIITMIIYKSVLTFGRRICNWLNRMSKLYSFMQGDPRSVLASNRFLVFYSAGFFFTINILSLLGLWTNANFINGAIAFTDSTCFVILLMIQNVFLCQFLTFLRLTELSFKRINEILKAVKVRPGKEREFLKKLKLLRAQHLTVTDFFYFLISVFELNLLFYVFWALMTGLFCTVIMVHFDLKDGLIILIWTIYHPFQNWPMIYICEMIYAESKKSVNLLQELLIQSNDPEIKEETEIFSLQLQHRPAEFIVCGFFQLDFKMAHSVIGTMTTYIIALLQIQPTYSVSDNTTNIVR